MINRLICWIRVVRYGYRVGHQPIRVIDKMRAEIVASSPDGLSIKGTLVDWHTTCRRCGRNMGRLPTSEPLIPEPPLFGSIGFRGVPLIHDDDGSTD